PDVMNRENIRMIKRGNGASFLFETEKAVCIASKRFRKNFQGHIAPKPRVARTVNFPHTTCAEGRLNFIRAYFCSRVQAHFFSSAVKLETMTSGAVLSLCDKFTSKRCPSEVTSYAIPIAGTAAWNKC